MYIDLLGPDNYINYNIKLAKYLGLHATIYLSALIKIKNIDRNNFIVDRRYITELTTFKKEEQLILDETLKKVNIIDGIKELSEDTFTAIINEDVVISMITETDIKALNKIKRDLDVKVEVPVGKMTQRQKQCFDLKSKIQCSNDELLQAYREWVDGVYANPKGFLSLKAISIFQKGIDEFANGDLDLALKIIDIATVNGYRDVQWAINLFNKDYAAQWRKEHISPVPKVVPVKKAQIGGEVF